MKIVFLIFTFFISNLLFAQVQSKIEWLADSISLGKPTPLAFSIRYPIGYSIIFPDSAKDFYPYELHSKKYFPTFFENHYAKDSVIYFINSFSIDSIQKIQLPYAYVFKLDTTFLKSNVVSIPFQRKVYNFTNHTPYLFDTDLIEIPFEPNYTLWFALLFIGVFIFSIFFRIIRKKIYNLWRLHKIYQEWKTLQLLLDKIFQYNDPKTLIYELNILWKNYLGTQNAIQPTSLTSKEFELWIQSIPFIENKKLFVELCKLEEQIFYASQKIDLQDILLKKEKLKRELERIYQEKRKSLYV